MQNFDKSTLRNLRLRHTAQKFKLFKPKGWGWLLFPLYLCLFVVYYLILISAHVIFVLPFIKHRKGFFFHAIIALTLIAVLFSYELYSLYYLPLGQVGRLYFDYSPLWELTLQISFALYFWFGVIFIIRIWVSSNKRIPCYDDVLNKVFLAKGLQPKKEFIKKSLALAKPKKLENFNALLNNELEYFASVEHLVLDKKAFKNLMNQVCVDVILSEGRSSVKQVKKTLTELYEERRYNTLYELINKYKIQSQESKKKLEMLGASPDKYTKIFCSSALKYLFYLLMANVLSAEKSPIFNNESMQVFLAKGKNAQRTFINKAFKLCKKAKFDELGLLINEERTYYKEIKSIVWTIKQYEERSREIILGYALFDKTSSSKSVNKRIARLYNDREYKILNELYDKFHPQVEEYKTNIIKTEGANAFTVEYDGKGTFDGLLIQKIGLTILCSIVNVITLFIAFPATVCWKQKWLCKHTIYDGKRLSFDGTGMQLFGKWIVWLLLSFVTFGIFAIFFLPNKVEAWKAKHTHINGEIKNLGGTFDGTALGRVGLSILCSIVNVFTLFICLPFTICWKQKWLLKHTVHDGKRLSFNGNGFQLIGKWIIWCLLTLVTFGIYGLFISLRMQKWKASHTHLSTNYEYVM